MPFPLAILFLVISIIFSITFIFIGPDFRTRLISTGCFLGILLCWYFTIKTVNNIGYVELTTKVAIVDNKAVIMIDDKPRLLSKITGESYKDGDVIKLKHYNEGVGIFTLVMIDFERIRDIKRVEE